MTDRPILFSGAMIRALLDGRKAQTRRLAWRRVYNGDFNPEDLIQRTENGIAHFKPTIWQKVKPGDRLWVRETWGAWPALMGGVARKTLRFKTEGPPRDPHNAWRWRPSIHMPRWASRITLVVTETRMERVQEISEEDAKTEGMEPFLSGGPLQTTTEPGFEYRVGFARLWHALHGPGSWEANPEVVALTFTVHQCNIDEMEAAA